MITMITSPFTILIKGATPAFLVLTVVAMIILESLTKIIVATITPVFLKLLVYCDHTSIAHINNFCHDHTASVKLVMVVLIIPAFLILL